MSPGHVSPGDTALISAVLPVASLERPLSVLVISATGPVVAHRMSSPIVVGRDESSDLVLPDQATSRRHARLTPCATGIEVTDLDSRNGTFVDGHPTHEAIVQPGSQIRIGSFVLLVVQLDELWQTPDVLGPLVGGPAVATVRRTVSLIGPTELPLMILGETGTGKEVVARLVHAASGRTGAFVAVNCAALPEHLVESELFGHVRGAFTGAERNRQGLLTLAHEGTLFLDELGELPLPAQAKLLRVLEDRMVRAVGAERSNRVDVRFVSATNVNLKTAVDERRFRADLFARLSAVEVHLPSLRHRREDIPSLIAFLVARAGLPSLQLSPDALEALLLHAWPHNIRELDNLVRAVSVRGSSVDLADLPQHLQAPLREARRAPRGEADARVRPSSSDAMRLRVVAALREHRGNVRRVAITLGLARGHVYRLLKRHDLDPASFRGAGPDGAPGRGVP